MFSKILILCVALSGLAHAAVRTEEINGQGALLRRPLQASSSQASITTYNDVEKTLLNHLPIDVVRSDVYKILGHVAGRKEEAAFIIETIENMSPFLRSERGADNVCQLMDFFLSVSGDYVTTLPKKDRPSAAAVQKIAVGYQLKLAKVMHPLMASIDRPDLMNLLLTQTMRAAQLTPDSLISTWEMVHGFFTPSLTPYLPEIVDATFPIATYRDKMDMLPLLPRIRVLVQQGLPAGRVRAVLAPLPWILNDAVKHPILSTHREETMDVKMVEARVQQLFDSVEVHLKNGTLGTLEKVWDTQPALPGGMPPLLERLLWEKVVVPDDGLEPPTL